MAVDTRVGRFAFTKGNRRPAGEGHFVKDEQLKRFQIAVTGGTVQATGYRLGNGNPFRSKQR